MTETIEIKTRGQVEKISRLAGDAPYPVWLSEGNVRLDARSLLGLFALIGHRASVVAGDGADPGHFRRMVRQMSAPR